MIVKRGKNVWHQGKRWVRASINALRDRLGIPPGRRAMAAYARPNILHINITGLGTDPNGDANGMRDQAETFQALYPESDYVFISHAEMDGDPLKTCEKLVDMVQAGNSAGAYTHVIYRGHSFGGAALMFFLNWLARQVGLVCYVVFYDPVPNPILGQFGRWQRPASAPTTSLCFVQRNGASQVLVFPCGTRVDGAVCVDVSDWGPEGKLFHSTMISDPRVWDMALRAMRKAVSP